LGRKLKTAVGSFLCFVAVTASSVASPQTSSARTDHVSRTVSSKFVVIGANGPVVGVNLWAKTNYPAAKVKADGVRMMSYIKNVLHASAVDIVWNFFAPSYRASSVEVTSATLSAANVGILTQIAKQDHLLVEYRPMMFVLNVVNNWEGMIAPSNPKQWFNSYYNKNLPYLRMAQKYYVSEYITGTEMDGVSRSPLWRTFLSQSAKVYHGQLSYADHQYRYFPPRTQFPPTKLLGLDMYEKINLPASAPLKKVVAAYEHYFTTVPTALLRRTAIDETGIEARAGAYQKPSFMYIPGKLDPQIQVNWFTAACMSVKRFHMRGVFFWKVDLTDYPITHPASSLSTFEGRAGAQAIARCASILR
jgi:hypothetical protein